VGALALYPAMLATLLLGIIVAFKIVALQFALKTGRVVSAEVVNVKYTGSYKTRYAIIDIRYRGVDGQSKIMICKRTFSPYRIGQDTYVIINNTNPNNVRHYDPKIDRYFDVILNMAFIFSCVLTCVAAYSRMYWNQ